MCWSTCQTHPKFQTLGFGHAGNGWKTMLNDVQDVMPIMSWNRWSRKMSSKSTNGSERRRRLLPLELCARTFPTWSVVSPRYIVNSHSNSVPWRLTEGSFNRDLNTKCALCMPISPSTVLPLRATLLLKSVTSWVKNSSGKCEWWRVFLLSTRLLRKMNWSLQAMTSKLSHSQVIYSSLTCLTAFH